MGVQDVATLLAVAAIVVGSVVGIGLLVGLVGLGWGPAGRAWATVVASVGAQSLWVAWGMAATAMAGSLYFSEIAGFVPCTYCWYQRIAMYPLVILIGIAAIRRDHDATRYMMPLAGVGALIASYHYLIQVNPDLSTGACTSATPCSAAYVWEFGFVSIPFMAMVAFAAIVLLLTIDRTAASRQGITD